MKNFRVKANVALDFIIRAKDYDEALATAQDKEEYAIWNIVKGRNQVPPSKQDAANTIFDRAITSVTVEEITDL